MNHWKAAVSLTVIVIAVWIIFLVFLFKSSIWRGRKDEFSSEVKYYVYNINSNDMSGICDTAMDDDLTTKIYIHGFKSRPCSGLPILNYTLHRPLNVGRIVFVSWEDQTGKMKSGLGLKDYFEQAEQVVPSVARHLARVLVHIAKSTKGQIEVVGHSLGAQIAARAARIFEHTTGKKLDKIVGLDPAGPSFNHKPESLQCTDAKEVQVIHTDAGKLGLGLTDNVCPSDIWANGGVNQPECPLVGRLPACSHKMAVYRYIDYLEGRLSVQHEDYRYDKVSFKRIYKEMTTHCRDKFDNLWDQRAKFVSSRFFTCEY